MSAFVVRALLEKCESLQAQSSASSPAIERLLGLTMWTGET